MLPEINYPSQVSSLLDVHGRPRTVASLLHLSCQSVVVRHKNFHTFCGISFDIAEPKVDTKRHNYVC